jgi:WD40 repeat protein/serine/threonine protein kinase
MSIPSTGNFVEQQLRQACLELGKLLRAGDGARAEDFFAKNPALAGQPESALELIYSEFVAREELGQRPTPQEYFARFPQWENDLRVQFEIHGLLTGNPVGAPKPTDAAGNGKTVPPLSPPDGPVADLVDKSVGSYDLLQEIARGSMGVVYRARHRTLQRIVALKMVLAGEHAGRTELARVRTEAEAVARLQHPNIVQIYEVGDTGTHPYLALEFVEEGSLAEKLAGQPQPARFAAELVRTLAEAMHYAHQRGIVHRDLKPANILLASGGCKSPMRSDGDPTADSRSLLADATPKITDFGLAKRLDQKGSQTATGAVFGTPSYMAPEQASGTSREIGPAADIYALGAILYEMLTGRPPFRAENLLTTLRQVVNEEPVAPNRLQPGVPHDLTTICLKCLQKEPRRRYATAGELAEDLRRFLAGEPIFARPISPAERAWKWAKRRPAVAALLTSLIVAALTLLFGSLWYNAQLQIAAAEARKQRSDAEAAAAEAQRQETEALRQARFAREQQAETLRQSDLVKRQYDAMRRSLYTIQLNRVEEVWRSDPDRGLRLLEDKERCPTDLRDFAWDLYYHLCKQERQFTSSHPGGARVLTFAPDGKTFATVGKNDTVVRVWDVGTCEERAVRRFPKSIAAIAFAPDSRTLAVAVEDRAIRLWDLTTEKERASLPVTVSICCLIFSADGRSLVMGARDGSVRVWDVMGAKETTVLPGHTAKVVALAFSPDGKRLTSSAEDQTIRVWDLTTKEERSRLDLGEQGPATLLTFSPDGKKLAVRAASKQNVEVWDIDVLSPQVIFKPVEEATAAVAFSPDSKLLASAGDDHVVKVWELESGSERYAFTGQAGRVRCLAFAPDGQRLASASDDGSVRLWVVGNRPDRDPVRSWGGKVAALTFAPDGKALAAAADFGVIKVCDPTTLDDLTSFDGRPNGATALAYTSDSRVLAVSFNDGSIRLWDAGRQREIGKLTGHRQRVWSIAFSPDDLLLASAGDDGTIRLWDLSIRKEQRTLQSNGLPVLCVVFSPDGKTLTSGSADGAVQVWDVSTGDLRTRLEGHRERVLVVRFSPDGKLLVTGGMDEAVKIWKVDTLTEHANLIGHVGYVFSVAFSPDGKTLAVGSGARAGSKLPGDVKLWDVATGHCRARLSGQTGPVAFSSNGRTLATVNNHTAVKLWHTGAAER